MSVRREILDPRVREDDGCVFGSLGGAGGLRARVGAQTTVIPAQAGIQSFVPGAGVRDADSFKAGPKIV